MSAALPPSFHRRLSLLETRLKRQHSLEGRRSPKRLPSPECRRSPKHVQGHCSPKAHSSLLQLRMSTTAETWSANTINQLYSMPPPNVGCYIEKPLPLLPVPNKTEGPFTINDNINKFMLLEVCIRLHNTFAHIPHTLSGSAAIAIEDNFRLPYKIHHVSLLTPPECLRAARCWDKTCGLPEFPGLRNAFGIKTSDGRVCIIKLKKSSDPFGKLDIKLVGGEFEIPILSIRSVANRIAKCYIRDMDDHMPLEIQREYCRDMRWALNCMIRQDKKFSEENRPAWILDRRFWLPFILSFPDMADLFKQVGLSVRLGEIVIVPWDDEEEPRRHWWQVAGQRGPNSQVRPSSYFDKDVNNGVSAKILGIRLLQERLKQHHQKKEREKKEAAKRHKAKEELKKRMDDWQRGIHEAADPSYQERPSYQEVPSVQGDPLPQERPDSPPLPPEEQRRLQVKTHLLRNRSPQDHLEMRRRELAILDIFPCPPKRAEKQVEQRKNELRSQLLHRTKAASDLRALLQD